MFTIDAGKDADLAFVVDSWRQSYWDAGAVRGMLRDDYFAGQLTRITRLLTRPDIRFVVARDEQDPTLVLGWALSSGDVLHYVFVRHKLRGLGMAKAMLDGVPIRQYTHRSQNIRAERTPKGWRYTPHVLENA